MQTTIIELYGIPDADGTSRAAHALQTLRGIDKIVIAASLFRIEITYDDRLTSIVEIEDVLKGSGYVGRTASRSRSELNCGDCGS